MRSFLAPLIIILAVTIWSCSKKPDTVLPPSLGAVSINGFHEADTLKGTISAQVAVAGSNQPSKIEVYANDSLIASGLNAPFNLQWNTFGVNNGAYKIKAIVYDNAGKQTQFSLDVIVSNILVTIEIDPKIYSLYSNVNYIVTDSAGSVISSVKYNGTDIYVPITAAHHDLKNRCNVFEVKTDQNAQTYITGYMNVPKRSVWDQRGITITNPDHYYNSSVNFTNLPALSRISISTDQFGLTFYTPQSVANITNYGFSSTSKQLVQYVDPNNNGHYGFFHLDTTKTSITMNLADSTFNNSVKKSLTIGGATDINLSLYGRWNKNYYSYYLLDNAYSQNSGIDTYFYPDGNYLTDYICNLYYIQNGWTFITDYTSLPPDVITPFGTTATIANNTLGSFSFTAQGSFDYYSVNFSDVTDKVYAAIYSTSAYPGFQFPDIFKLANLSNISVNSFKPFSFSLFKTPGVDLAKFPYYNPNEFPALTLPSQSATKYF